MIAVRPLIAKIALCLIATVAGPAAAQQGSAQPAAERWVQINAYPLPEGTGTELSPGKAIFRRAALIEEPQDLLRGDDPFVVAWIAKGGPAGGLTLTIPIAADGRAGSCSGTPGRGTSDADVAALCKLVVARASFLPALLSDRTTMADAIEVNITLADMPPWDKRQTGPVRRSYVERLAVGPSPPPAGEVWPFTRHFSFWNKPTKTKIKPRHGLSAPLAVDAKWVGVFVGDGALSPKCGLRASSGDKAFEVEACRWVERSLKPEWSGDRNRANRRYPFLIVKEGNRISIVEPGFDEGADAVLPEAEAQRITSTVAAERPATGIRRAPQAEVRIGRDGRVLSCEIAQTSGTNPVDYALCRTLLDTAQYVPAFDIFGMPKTDFVRFKPSL